MSASGKFTNHSVRKTCIKTLLDSGVSHNNVAQLSGYKSLKSLDSYAVASREQQREMSKIPSGEGNNSKPKSKPKAPKENLQARRENTWLRKHGPRCARSVRPDLEPNIFPSGPLTQSISTYNPPGMLSISSKCHSWYLTSICTTMCDQIPRVQNRGKGAK